MTLPTGAPSDRRMPILGRTLDNEVAEHPVQADRREHERERTEEAEQGRAKTKRQDVTADAVGQRRDRHERQVASQALERHADGHRVPRRVARPHDERWSAELDRILRLCPGQEHRSLRLIVQIEATLRLDDADDVGAAATPHLPVERHTEADDVAIRRYQSCHRVVDHGHRFGASAVRCLEGAAAEEASAGRLEITRTGQGQGCKRLLHCRFTRPGPERDWHPAVERLQVDDCRALDGRKIRQPRERALVERVACLWRVMGALEIDPGDEGAIDVDTAANRIHVPQRPNEQPSADEERQRQGDLQHDQRPSRVVPSQRARRRASP